MKWTPGLCGIATLLACPAAHAEADAELARMLERNATSSAYAHMCDEEPIAEQLKANTMMLLAVNGLPVHNVQLGSAKYSQIIRREFNATKRLSDVDCPARVAQAKEHLSETLNIIRSMRRPEPAQ